MDENLHNISIERAVLSAMIYLPGILDELERFPDEQIFFYPAHREIYRALMHLYEAGLPIEEEYVRSFLQKRNVYDEVVFLEVLAASPISNVGEYVKELEELAHRRRFLTLGIEIRSMAEENKSSSEMADRVEKRLLEFSDREQRGGFAHIGEALSEAEDYVETMKQKSSGLTGIDTGYTTLNALTGGFNAGDLVILAARPAMGKTSLAIRMMMETSKFGNGTALLSLEMPRDQIALRMLSVESGISLQKIRTGKIDDREQKKLMEARRRLENRSLLIDDTPNLTIRDIRSKVRRILTRNPSIKLVVLDYLQLIESTDNKDRHLQVAEISRGLKLLARELNIAILALSQLNRSLETRSDKRPILSDLRESGSIEQDADIVLFVYRDDVYKKEEEKQKAQEMKKKGIDYRPAYTEKENPEAELIIGKQRNGPLGVVKLEFQKELATFVEPNSFQEIIYE